MIRKPEKTEENQKKPEKTKEKCYNNNVRVGR